MLPIKKIISFTILVLVLSCNTSFATVASDFTDKSLSIETLVINALTQDPPLTLDEIIAQLPDGTSKEEKEGIEKAYTELTGSAAAGAAGQAFAAPKKSSRSYSSISGGGPTSASEN